MQVNWRFLLAGFVALFGFSACEEDFDPNADYQETAIIYSLLDKSQPVQYVKVTKAFLNTRTNALLIAANHPDSSNFYHPITVELQKLNPTDSSVIISYPLQRKDVLNKEPGAFSTAQQMVYASDSNQVVMEDKDLFRVLVTNTTTGKQYKGATRILGELCVGQVGYDPVALSCDPVGTSQGLQPFSIQNLRFSVKPEGQIFKATYYLIYKEFKNGVENIDTVEFIALNNSIILANPNNAAGFNEDVQIERNAMYKEMLNDIDYQSDDASTTRTMQTCVVKVTAGGEELRRYVQVNNAYSAITQSRPEYSNITNGAGLFSSRYTRYINAHFNQKSIDTLRLRYSQLKFTN